MSLPSSSVESVTITLKLFAAYQEAYQQSELSLTLPKGSTVADVCDRLIGDRPELERWQSVTRFGINLQFVEPDTQVEDGDEVVLIPPVSGG
ncbi:MAG: MoaD/ThiS family protein [Elainellaceae cyanobacterium]